MSKRETLRTMVFGTGGPQTEPVAVRPLLARVAALIVLTGGLYGLIALLSEGHWRWGVSPVVGIGLAVILSPVLLRPIRHRWPALVAGGLVALLITFMVIEHVRDVPGGVGAVAGMLAGAAAFAGITHLPVRFFSHGR